MNFQVVMLMCYYFYYCNLLFSFEFIYFSNRYDFFFMLKFEIFIGSFSGFFRFFVFQLNSLSFFLISWKIRFGYCKELFKFKICNFIGI